MSSESWRSVKEAQEVVRAVGATVLSQALGLARTTVYAQALRGYFPAHYGDVIRAECQRVGHPLDERLIQERRAGPPTKAERQRGGLKG